MKRQLLKVRMASRHILIIIAVAMFILDWRQILSFGWWPAYIFGAWVIWSFIDIKIKNRDRRTPRPVYLAKPQ